jgi:F1F0 ATPase subunit 2
MDAERMTRIDPALAGYLAAGLLLGAAYFRTLRWTSDRLAAGSGVRGAIAAIVGRFALLGGALAWISMQGALPLLLTALGVFVGRAVVLRQARVLAA